MKRSVAQYGIALTSGSLFGSGLVVGGMTQPRKVIGFLDVAGAWDPSLVFVMAGAVFVHALAYRWIKGRVAPLCADRFALPTRRVVDFKLLAGGALFGIGWGLAGYCPGPALVSLGSAAPAVLVFVTTMLLGMSSTAKLEIWAARERPSRPCR